MLKSHLGDSMKKVVFIIMFIVMIITITGAVIINNNYRSEKKERESILLEVSDKYNDFKKKVESFSNIRSELYESTKTISYLEQLPSIYNSLIKTLTEEDKEVTEIEKTSAFLLDYCLSDSTLKNKDTKSKCSAFIENYEQSENFLILDIKYINDYIDNYNNNYVTNCSELTNCVGSKSLDKYESKHKDYVDINKDGKFSGIEE